MDPGLEGRSHLSISPQGHLLIDGVDSADLVARFGSPLYVVSGNRLRNNFRDFKTAFQSIYNDILICFAYKANAHLAVCKLLKDEGAGAEVASGGELYIALKAGVPPERIVFDGPNKTYEELEAAIEAGVMLINADSAVEIKKIGRIASLKGRKVTIGIRVNPDISVSTHEHLATGLGEHKFGVWIEDALDTYKLASEEKSLNVAGILAHIGSGISDTGPFKESVRRVFGLISRVKNELKLEIRLVDLGGGLGISYEIGQSSTAVTDYARTIASSVKEEVQKRELQLPTLILEPGRAIVGDAGILLTTVGVVKETARRNWVIADAGMNLLLRPALYDAYHEILVANKASEASERRYSVGGPCCESADYLARDRNLPRLVEGDLLAVLDVGAYGFTMSSRYNSYPRCAVVMTENGSSRMIRSRESCEDLVRHEFP